jgi:hypothetical protein
MSAAPDPLSAGRRTLRWELVVVFMALLLLFLGFQLWRRIQGVDPRLRCAGAYENVHTAVDSSLVDGISVHWPDRATRTTCGQLRASGALETLPRRPQGGILPPRP